MKPTYSKEQFEGYTHRFAIQCEVGDPYFHNITVYSNSDSYTELEAFFDEKKSDKVISFRIVHRASKEQDELTARFIDETLKDI